MSAYNGFGPALARPASTLLDRFKRLVVGPADDEPGWTETLPAQPEWSETMPAPADPLFDRPLVLVVDDSPINLIVTREMLAVLGIKPLLAAHGAEAVAVASELRLDLILMDLQMPVLDGFAATAQIRRFEREHARRRVPVVAYTSTRLIADEPRLKITGIDAVLRKPADVQAIQACVMRWCGPVGTRTPAHRADLHRRAGQASINSVSSTRSAT